ncbi:phage/plasmid primase, P4 family [Bacillus sp. FSL W7-1360]
MAQYNFENIPQELRQCKQWILWRKEMRGDRISKVPYQVNRNKAATDKPEQWSSFDDVVMAYDAGGFDGIGFVFTKNDEFVGVDIDHCIKDGTYSDLAKDVMDRLSSYTELSPSGEGLHIIIKGKLPLRGHGTGKKNPALGLEIYRHGRYFTVTGNKVNGDVVANRTDAMREVFGLYIDKKQQPKKVHSGNPHRSSIADLSDRELLDRMFASRKGEVIRALYNGHHIDDDHSASDMAFCNHLAFWTDRDAVRMDSIFRSSALMRDKWDSQRGDSTYGAQQIDKAISECSVSVSEYNDSSIATEKKSRKKEENILAEVEASDYHLTELGNAERMKSHMGKAIRYCKELGWLLWDGKTWCVDECEKIELLAAETFRKLYDEGFKELDEEKQKAILKWAKRCESRNVMLNSVKDLRPMVAVAKRELDTHMMLFNCQNGVINLETGELVPHDKKYMITQISPVDYDKNADCPRWKAFLEDVIVDVDGNTDHEVINYLQKVLGYSLTGSTKEQAMFFLYGTGKNGKSTLIDTVQKIMGDYGKQSNTDAFIKKKFDSGINNDIARLDGARFVAAVESEEGQQLSESLVKQITGGDKVTARFMRQEYFEFTPEFKVFFATNHKPIIRNDDEGIWRRIHLIPFLAAIPKEKQDKDLVNKLGEELPGILKWMVEGALKWHSEGLDKPESIAKATKDYRDSMDMLGPFLSEMCVVHPGAKVEAKKGYKEYKQWCYENDETEVSNRKFYRLMESRGFKKKRGAKNKVFVHGVGLKTENISLAYSQESLLKDKKGVEKVTLDSKSNPDIELL